MASNWGQWKTLKDYKNKTVVRCSTTMQRREAEIFPRRVHNAQPPQKPNTNWQSYRHCLWAISLGWGFKARQAGRHSNQYNVTVKYFCSFWLCAALYYYGRGVVDWLKGIRGKRCHGSCRKKWNKANYKATGSQQVFSRFMFWFV